MKRTFRSMMKVAGKRLASEEDEMHIYRGLMRSDGTIRMISQEHISGKKQEE